jgi:hypothetical protein
VRLLALAGGAFVDDVALDGFAALGHVRSTPRHGLGCRAANELGRVRG